MDIISALGVNYTIGYQFIIFMVVYLFLYGLIFKPYFRAYEERTSRTVGNQDQAQKFLGETAQLQAEYEQKAQAINAQFKVIFDKARGEALKEQERIAQGARERATMLLDKARADLKTQMESARRDLVAQTPELTNSIMTQILGKEIRL